MTDVCNQDACIIPRIMHGCWALTLSTLLTFDTLIPSCLVCCIWSLQSYISSISEHFEASGPKNWYCFLFETFGDIFYYWSDEEVQVCQVQKTHIPQKKTVLFFSVSLSSSSVPADVRICSQIVRVRQQKESHPLGWRCAIQCSLHHHYH